MGIEEQDLDRLFSRYRAACTDIDASQNFMPDLWARIEARGAFWPTFERLSRFALAICATACLVLLLLDVRTFGGAQSLAPTYADELASEQNSEANYYAEAVRPVPAPSPDSQQ